MAPERRVRPQAPVFEDGRLSRLLYSTDGSGEVSIATALAETDNGGYTWRDHHENPVLDRIESGWQGNRAFVTGLTREEGAERWVMATVGDDDEGPTPGSRAVGLWFSGDLITWTQYADNPVITVEDGNPAADEVFPAGAEDPVGMYLRDFRQIEGRWHALVQWRGWTWSRMVVMESDDGITGPWSVRNRCLDPAGATPWFRRNDVMNWCQPIRIGDRWYAVCQNGVGGDAEDNERLGLVYSEDYFEWQELDNPVTPPLTRPNGTPLVSSQQFLLPPEGDAPWRILLGARGEVGSDSYMYLVKADRVEAR